MGGATWSMGFIYLSRDLPKLWFTQEKTLATASSAGAAKAAAATLAEEEGEESEEERRKGMQKNECMAAYLNITVRL